VIDLTKRRSGGEEALAARAGVAVLPGAEASLRVKFDSHISLAILRALDASLGRESDRKAQCNRWKNRVDGTCRRA
jgi:hypothetical protein